MAEMVLSLIVGEVINRVSSFLLSKLGVRLTTQEGIERLEIAHIKMEAALDVSRRWRSTDVSLLHWRRKLRCAADECDAALHRWKLRALEEEEARERLARAPLPRRVAHAVTSFVSALLARGDDDDGVERFEKLANGAAEFMKYVEFSGAPRNSNMFDPIVQKLGNKGVNSGVLQGVGHRFLEIESKSLAEGGLENKTCRGHNDRRSRGKELLRLL